MKDTHFCAKKVFIHPALSPQLVNKSVLTFFLYCFYIFIQLPLVRFMHYFHFLVLLD